VNCAHESVDTKHDSVANSELSLL